jgi:hypothetical protein
MSLSEACFDLFGCSVILSVRWVHSLRRTHPMVLQGDVGQAEAHFIPFGDSFNLVEDRCTVCDECTTRMEVGLAHPIVLLGNVCQVEACFGLFGDSVSIGTRYVHGLCQMYHRLGNHFGRT